MIRLFSLVLLVTLAPAFAMAQSLGTFRWQLEPYCNLVTLAITQSGAVYEVEGTDDQCGAATAASAIGTAFLNPDGSIGFGLNIVTSPSATPVHVEASIGLATLSGTWHDSAGATGTFRFTPGATTGGAPRPPGGSIGAASVNPSQVQLRIGASCADGTFMQGVGQAGSVACAAETGDIAGVGTGQGLSGGGSSGVLTLDLARTESGAFRFSNNAGFVALGSGGTIPIEGPGTRAMWYPREAAFRAGTVTGTQWDAENIGTHSVAFGLDAMATGWASVAMGERVRVSGRGSVVLGTRAIALPGVYGTFIFADASGEDFIGYSPNEFLVRSSAGAAFYTDARGISGVALARGASAWSAVSDVNMKENFRDLDDDDVLSKIARMPVREWNYKAQEAAIRHVGPTAQDFHAAFGLGEDPLRISTTDADGIALRAVQALEARTRLTDERNRALQAELSALRDRLAQLEARKP